MSPAKVEPRHEEAAKEVLGVAYVFESDTLNPETRTRVMVLAQALATAEAAAISRMACPRCFKVNAGIHGCYDARGRYERRIEEAEAAGEARGIERAAKVAEGAGLCGTPHMDGTETPRENPRTLTLLRRCVEDIRALLPSEAPEPPPCSTCKDEGWPGFIRIYTEDSGEELGWKPCPACAQGGPGHDH